MEQPTVCYAIVIEGRRSPELYETRQEAENALGDWSIRRYQMSGNFDHDKLAQIVVVE